MCLLINHPANTSFDFDDIADFFSYNSDGLGVMYAEDNAVKVRKMMPRDEKDAWEFYQEHCQGRDCVIHLRMRTHGHTDLTNCHPYEVYGTGTEMPIYMAHNGILSTGNDKDVSKSDTWHYIRDFVIPLTKASPAVVFDEAFIDIIETHIGSSNKFIFMNHEGRVSIINERAFVTYKGAQLSNTYAWTSENGGYGVKRSYGRHDPKAWQGYTPASTKSAFDDWDDSYYSGRLDKPAVINRQPAVSYLPTASRDDDSTDFALALFEVLDDEGLSAAYKALDWNDAVALYDALGDEQAYVFLEEIETAGFNDEQITSYITGVLLRAVANG